MARIRTINDALVLIQNDDKDTAITYNFIKNLCVKGKVPSYKIGSKQLLNYDLLIKYLDTSLMAE